MYGLTFAAMLSKLTVKVSPLVHFPVLRSGDAFPWRLEERESGEMKEDQAHTWCCKAAAAARLQGCCCKVARLLQGCAARLCCKALVECQPVNGVDSILGIYTVCVCVCVCHCVCHCVLINIIGCIPAVIFCVYHKLSVGKYRETNWGKTFLK